MSWRLSSRVSRTSSGFFLLGRKNVLEAETQSQIKLCRTWPTFKHRLQSIEAVCRSNWTLPQVEPKTVETQTHELRRGAAAPGRSPVRAPFKFSSFPRQRKLDWQLSVLQEQQPVLPLILILTIQLPPAHIFQRRTPTSAVWKSLQRIPGNSYSLQETRLSDKHFVRSAAAHLCLSSCCCWASEFILKSCCSPAGVTW